MTGETDLYVVSELGSYFDTAAGWNGRLVFVPVIHDPVMESNSDQ
jgi:hypothetical protein